VKRLATLVGLLCIFTLGAVAPLGRAPSREDESRRRAAAAALGIADLCLASDARWLRHPSLSEPGAAFADLPGGPDAQPAGMVLAPPVPLFVETR
jgi:hypothetical protein